MEYPSEEFDWWSQTYDQDVRVDSFPFAGYDRVLDTVVNLADVQSGGRVLDIGTGTGNLAGRFIECGCLLYCTDFSPAMISVARSKFPQAVYLVSEMRSGLPFGSQNRAGGVFDCIVSAYVFHHFPLEQKIENLTQIVRLLVPGGLIVIADIAFRNVYARNRVQEAAGEAWEEEYYWIADRALPALESAGFRTRFVQVSSCGGVFSLQPA